MPPSPSKSSDPCLLSMSVRTWLGLGKGWGNGKGWGKGKG
jgi:hypothetical protein